jgi:hypothetical protein
MSTASVQKSDSAPRSAAFREDGTFRLPLELTPSRHRPRGTYKRPKFADNPIESLRRRKLPNREGWERGRQVQVLGDPLADDYAVLYRKLGHQKARELLDMALDHGIENVPDAPPQLRALFAEVDRVPEWVEWDRVERGAAVMRRYAPITWLFLRLAFAQTFVNANAGMPLYMSGSLGAETAAKRLWETDRWRLGVQQPGALRRHGDGFKTVVRVRVLHALIRFHLLASGKWDVERMGMPIPQLDMAGANVGMMMAHSFLPMTIGAIISPSEINDVVHFWRYHGWLNGVVEDLNPKSVKDLQRINNLIATTTRLAHDERASVLTRSTMNAKLRTKDGLVGKVLDYIDIRASHGLYELANGKKIYKMMKLDSEPKWLWFFPALFPAILTLETVRKVTPFGTRIAEQLGKLYIDRVMQVEDVKNAPFQPYHARG